MNNNEVLRIGRGLEQETYKYLGVLIGEGLTFSEHVNRIEGKLVSPSFMLNQSKSFLPFKARLVPSLRVISTLLQLYGQSITMQSQNWGLFSKKLSGTSF